MTIDKRIIEQFNARAPFQFEDGKMIVLAQIGSHSHNTYVPKDDPQAIDDVDYMGIIVPPMSFTLGTREWESLQFQFEELDCVFYSFRKFIQLCIKSNPNVLGLAWLRPEDLIEKSPEWDQIVNNRHLFSSLRAFPAFIGYARGQLDRMTSFDIKTQNEWDDAIKIVESIGWTKEQVLNKEHLEQPSLDVYESLDDLLGEFYERDNHKFIYGTDLIAVSKNAVETLQRIHGKHFQGYMGEKRKNLVRKYGYDTKNAAHLIRLMRMCCEFLETEKLNVYRTHDAQEIRDIKSGKWTVEEVKAEADRLFARAERVKKNSKLPEHPKEQAIDIMVVDIYLSAYELQRDYHLGDLAQLD